MINTFSAFYYGTTVSDSNFRLPFSEGGPELGAELEFGGYSLSEITVEVKRALDLAGAQEYTVSVDRNTRIVTISAAGNFELLLSSGSTVATSVFSLIGFTQGSDLTGSNSYSGISGAGSVYLPQGKLQSYVDKEDSQSASQGTVHKSASGQVEAVTFGTDKFYEMDMRWTNNYGEKIPGLLNPNSTGVEDLRAFMQEITRKGRFEFMPDVDDKSTFDKVILERTAESAQGTAYKLKEQFNIGLPGYYDTGVLTLRVVE